MPPRRPASGPHALTTQAAWTPEAKAKIIAALKGGRKGTDLAREFNISHPMIQYLKKGAGLVKERKKA